MDDRAANALSGVFAMGGRVLFALSIAAFPEDLPRDTLAAIAKRYGVSIGDVVRWNELDAPDRIHPGDRLRVAERR